MDYITPKEAADKWGVGIRRVQFFCAENRIPGAIRVGRQWLIPANSHRPDDCRARLSVREVESIEYRFPIMIYSADFNGSSELTEADRQLLRGQILFAQGNYFESIRVCKKLLSNSLPDYIRFGAYCTTAHSYLLTGLKSELNTCIAEMEKICAANPDNRADYRFIIDATRYQFTFDSKPLLKTDVDKLSADALITYRLAVMQTSMFDSEAETPTAIKAYNAFCKELEYMGIRPALQAAHGILAFLCERAGNQNGEQQHIEQACRLCSTEKYFSLFTKYYSFNENKYQQCLAKYDTEFAAYVYNKHRQDIVCWLAIYNSDSAVHFQTHDIDVADILLLLALGYSNAEISTMKGITCKQVSEVIKSLYDRYNCRTRQELVALARRIFFYDRT